MGFYGNITNTSKTQFQFDRIYPNRLTMENLMSTDNVYFGRYVLVEYDTETRLDAFLRVYMSDLGVAYTTPNAQPETMIYEKDLKYGDIVYTAASYIEDKELVPRDCVFWKCISNYVEGTPNVPAVFEKAVSSDSIYVTNFNIDTAKYGESRGYDSTVWQKVYIDGIEKYIQIAELNSVVPTFDISADAPTVYPIQPHFDINSTNVYYKLHWQPQWGMRVKEAVTNVTTSQDNQLQYPSDESVDYTQYVYNPQDGNLTDTTVHYDAAIYYNKEGFKKDKRTYHNDFTDNIQVMPTGISGNAYNVHSNQVGNNTNNTQPDIQEFKILLPSLGNTISDIWDIIYGYNKKVHEDETIEITNDSIRFRDFEWKDVVTGAENVELGGMTRDVNTLAGCINKVHDLMGMIITSKNNSQVQLNEEWYAKNYLYEDNGKYYRIHKFPLYALTQVKDVLSEFKNNTYPSDQEYNTAYENIVKTLLQDKEYYLILDNTTLNYKVKTLNEKAISALTDEDIIGYQTGDYGYDFVEVEGLPGKMATIYGLILQMKKLLEVEDSQTRDRATVTGAINSLNDIIEVFEDLVPGEFLVCDANGHVNSMNWTTAQEFDYDNIGNNKAKVQKTFNTNENRWLSLSINEDAEKEENRVIQLHHKFNQIDDTRTSSDKNDEQNHRDTTVNEGLNHSAGNTIDLYTPIVDNKGHVVGKNTETVTLPYGFKRITSNGRGSDVEINSYTEPSNPIVQADNVQSTFALNSGNRWIRIDNIDGETNSLTFKHDIHPTSTSTSTQELEIEDSQDVTFNIPTYAFDEAGHYVSHDTKTLSMPFGYGIIVGDANTTKTKASATYDTLTLDTDEWLTTTVSQDKVTFTHDYPEEKADTSSSFDMNNADNTADQKNKIILETLTHDTKGHIINVNQHTVTLPYGYKTFKDSNDTVGSTSAVETQDTFVFKGDSWIKPTVTQDLVTYTHIGPVATSATPKNNIANPEFGSTFTIEDWHYDSKGHKNNLTTHTVQFPKGSLDAAQPNNSDVVLQLEFTPETGAIKTQRVNIANLKLASYNKATDSSDIAATDTLGQALSKLQTQISAEETRINNLELDESAAEGSYISSIKQIDGQVSFGTTALPSVTDAVVNGQYVSAVSESNGKISVSRAALPSVTDEAVSNQYISAVNQSNGQISITRESLPDYSSYWDIIEDQGKTIEDLVKTIEDLTKRIVDLEAYHNSSTPEEPEEPVIE